MPAVENLHNFLRLGLISPRLMILAWNIKRSKRTYLTFATLHSLADNFNKLRNRSSTPLQVAEFGVGRGGSATLLAWLVNNYGGQITLYDVFGRIPAPGELDGERAKLRYKTILSQEGAQYYGNISNLLEVVLHDIYQVCQAERVSVVQGKYEDTLPTLKDQREYNLVHIDCDWYESSVVVYNYLRLHLRPGAIIQVDDYSNWEGSKRAFHDAAWLSKFQTHIVEGALVIDTSISVNNKSSG